MDLRGPDFYRERLGDDKGSGRKTQLQQRNSGENAEDIGIQGRQVMTTV